MYRRLEAALAHQGYARQPAQTAYEFAHVAGGNLAESLSLMEFFSVHDAKGKHVYDMHLFCDEDGQVFAPRRSVRAI